jgi:hypothetical protein
VLFGQKQKGPVQRSRPSLAIFKFWSTGSELANIEDPRMWGRHNMRVSKVLSLERGTSLYLTWCGFLPTMG